MLLRTPSCVLAVLALASPTRIQQGNLTEAIVPVLRLSASEFPELPEPIAEQLDAKGCLIPQTGILTTPTNVVSGEFLEAGKSSWAVLCSVDGFASIHVFDHANDLVAELGSRPDRSRIRDGQEVDYTRNVDRASPDYIRSHYEAYGDEESEDLPEMLHDGIDDGVMEKGSSIHYFTGTRWIRLPGAD